MVALLTVVMIATLGVTHFVAYWFGGKHMESFIFYRYHRPLRFRHSRLVKAFSEATLEDSASAQQRNVKLVAQNALLRGKAILYARAFGRVRRQLHKKPMNQLFAIMGLLTAANDQLDRAKRRRAS